MDKVSYSPVHATLSNPSKAPKIYAYGQVDMKNIYSEEELDKILSRFDCLHKTKFGSNEKCVFDMVYLPTIDGIVINNKNMTNDTVEIAKDGVAMSVGSWHQKKLEGDYSDIVIDAKSRFEAAQQNKENAMKSELDAMAELGKSQIK